MTFEQDPATRAPVRHEARDREALATDRYLDELLAAGDRRAADVPSDEALDTDVRSAATRLRRDLVRAHPSFRFEERLAARLAQLAASRQLPVAAGAERAPIPFPIHRRPTATDEDETLVAVAEGRLDPAADPESQPTPLPRPILLGGAVASAALSIAGVAWVAWRRTRPPAGPMARAVRAAAAARRHPDRAIRRGWLA